MRKLKLCSICLSVIMLASVFAIPATGYASTGPAPAPNQKIAAPAADDITATYPVTGGSIYFTITNNTAIVTLCGHGVTAADIPSTISAGGVYYPVTGIGDNAFYACQSLKSVTIPDGVTSIGANAFNDCVQLTSITIPDSVTSIGASAFNECTTLTAITIPKSVTSIGDAPFRICSSLESITVASDNPAYADIDGVLFNKAKTKLIQFPAGSAQSDYQIPSGVTDIGTDAFHECYNLQTVTLPEGLAALGEYAFYYCTELKSIAIPKSVTVIANTAFEDCYSLEKITVAGDNLYYTDVSGVLFNKAKTSLIKCPPGFPSSTYQVPAGVTGIGAEGFRYCANLESITLPGSLTTLGESAFESCSGLTTVTLPAGITSIGDGTFCNCSSLKTVTLPAGVTSIEDSTFAQCESLQSIVIPDSVTNIGPYAFYLCSNLKNITLPSNLTSIGESAFYACDSLQSIVIPNRVTSLNSGTFAECSSLQSIAIPDSVTSIADDAFSIGGGFTIYGRAGSAAQQYTGPFGNVTFVAVAVPRITAQPTGANYAGGVAAKPLSVTAVGDSKTTFPGGDHLTYQWYQNSASSNANGKKIAGAVQPAYTPATMTVGAAYYYVVVANLVSTVTSNPARITVTSKPSQAITGKAAFTKVYGNKAFSLNAKASGNGKLTYKSNHTAIATVSAAGKVTIKGTGIVKITVTAAATGNYAAATKAVTITVHPKKAAGLKLKAGTKRLTASWKKDTKATGYQLVYAKNSKFTSGKKTITIKKYSTYKKTITKLTKGKTYYVKVRAYKMAGKTKLYGAYSAVKKGRVQ